MAAGGNLRMAVTFEALTSGPLIGVALPTFKLANSLGDYILRLSPVNNSGVPTNDELASTIAANVHVPDGDSTVTFTFPNPYSVVAGADYALVLTRSSQFQWNSRKGDPCSGRTFVSSDQTAAFTEDPIYPDLVFTTFVRS